jgi:GAF domain-containing protein/predicted Ser/Thr protein kinase
LIGRRLQAVFDADGGSNQKLLELVRHLNLGSAAISGDSDRRELARLNLRAAKAAKANGSYRLQATLVGQAQDLLGERAWQDERQLFIDLAIERIEADYMLREFDEVHRRARELLALPLPNVTRLMAQGLRVQCCQVSGQFTEGERIGLEALAEQGSIFPESNEACTTQCFMLLMECQTWLDEHPDGFSRMPLELSVEHLLRDTIEAALVNCVAFGSRPMLAGILSTRNVLRMVERGTVTLVNPYFIACMASLRSIILGKYREDVRWIQEGLSAARRVGSSYLAECIYFEAYYAPHHAPPERFREGFIEAARVGLAAGSFQGTSWGLLGEVYCVELWPGRSLAIVAAQVAARNESMMRYGDVQGQHGFALIQSIVEFLRSSKNARPGAEEPWLTNGSGFFTAQGDNYMAELARIEEAQCYLAFGEYARALDRADEADLHRPEGFGSCAVTNIPLWRALASAKLLSITHDASKRAQLMERIEFGVLRLRYFAEGCAENFSHKLHLIEAERARVFGKYDEAAAKYDEAIDSARKEGFLQIEGLAAFLCAQFYLEQGRTRIAKLYLHNARDAYARWDAQALVAHLEQRYPDLLNDEVHLAKATRLSTTLASTNLTSTSLTSTGETSSGTALDVHTVIRAAQALAGELDPDRVVGRLMELCLANAGAERGALVLLEEKTLVLVARLSVRDMRIETGLSIPLSQYHDMATTVIHYVTRSREAMVVNDVSTEKRFSDDPYVVANTVRSLLAMPMTHGGRLGGVLYLEHRTVPGAFPPARVEMLSVLASQAAIAVENAKLVRNIETQVRTLEARNREVQELNDELRRQIAQRSRRLMDSLLPHDGVTATSGSFKPDSLLGDRYRVIRMVGEGAMGVVYEVERTTDGKHLAAKVLNHSPDREDLGRFVREAHILASLSHPNLISIYDVDVTDAGVLYIVMEFVAGTTLREIENHVGDVPFVLGVLQQVAKALEALHASSVVHRDLKPENILVVLCGDNKVPIVKLADFGISIMNTETPVSLRPTAWDRTISADSVPSRPTLERGPMLTQTGVLVGTPVYMGPELGYGSKNAQSSSDIFSFGVIAFELLTGQRPYTFPPVLGGLILDDVAERLGQCADLTVKLANLFARCVAVAPEKRPLAGDIVRGIGEG